MHDIIYIFLHFNIASTLDAAFINVFLKFSEHKLF